MRVDRLGFVLAALGLAACGGLQESDLFEADAGTVDAASGSDGTTVRPPGLDATTPVIDTGITITPDGKVIIIGPVPETGTGVPDVVIPIDTGTTTTPGITCGAFTCSGAVGICCVTNQGSANRSYMCVSDASECTATGALPVACESSSDCTTGNICCANFAQTSLSSVACAPFCSDGVELCNPSSNGSTCATPTDRCNPSQIPGYGYCQAQ